MIFPLNARPPQSYKIPPRCFGAKRADTTRLHAGCDLYGIAGTPVRSIAAGTVIQVYAFYKGTDAVEIRHEFGIVRYCEVKQIVVAAGQQVERGQSIASIGRMEGMSQMMLHLELYRGDLTGPLTDRVRMPYMRRADLVDPTALLDSLPVE